MRHSRFPSSPSSFQTFAHEGFRPWPDLDRDHVLWRATDRHVRRSTGVVPLRVPADKIGFVAERAARLQARFAAELWDGHPAPRDGTGRLVEAYPAAALAVWGLPHRGYKNGGEAQSVRSTILDGLAHTLPWLDLAGVWTECLESDHLLDAVISAAIGTLVRLGRAAPIADPEMAAIEGWIRLPLPTVVTTPTAQDVEGLRPCPGRPGVELTRSPQTRAPRGVRRRAGR